MCFSWIHYSFILGKKKYQQEIFSSRIIVSYHYLFIYLLAFSLVFIAHSSLPPNPFHSAFMHVVLDNILNAPSLKSSSPSTDIYVEPVQRYFHCYHIYIYLTYISLQPQLSCPFLILQWMRTLQLSTMQVSIRIFKNIMGRPTFPYSHRAPGHSEIRGAWRFPSQQKSLPGSPCSWKQHCGWTCHLKHSCNMGTSWKALLKKKFHVLHQTSSPKLSLHSCFAP